MKKAEKIIRKKRKELFEKRNVVMLVPGTKKVAGVDTGKKALVVGVTKKLPLAQLAAEDVVPRKVEGLVTDVIEVGEIKFLEEESPDRKKKWRPAPGGVSIGHYRVTAGTLGMVVRKNGERYILSNNHVLADSNQGEIGDLILQPGSLDGGKESDKIAKLSEFKYINIEKLPGPELTLLSPNGGETWTIGQVAIIEWRAEASGNIRIEISRDGGVSWVTLNSSVPTESGQWSWKVTSPETEKARIKVVDITNSPFNSDMSDSNFVIKHPEQSTCRTSKATAATLNLLWAAAGRKTRFVAVVPTSQAEPESNLVDAALAKPINDAEISDEILEAGVPGGFVEPEVGMKVKKSGRTTGLTHGEITHSNATIKVNFRENRFATFVDQIITTPMVEGGDSGSVLLTEDNEVAGLIFAGSTQLCVACKISSVRKLLELD